MIATKAKTFLVALWLLLAIVGVSVGCTRRNPWHAKNQMPTTIRQKFVDKLKLRLARISVVNGFQTDIGAALQTQAARDFAEWPRAVDELEARTETLFGIFDRETETTQEFPREKQVGNVMPIQVRIYHAAKTTPAELRTMIGDVQRAIIENEDTGERDAEWRTWDADAGAYVVGSGLAIDTKETRSGFVVPQNVFAIDAGAVEFQVEFLSEPFNAYC